MNKNKSAFSFAVAGILLSSLLFAPMSANAGGTLDFPGRPDGFPGKPDAFPGQGVGTPPSVPPGFRNSIRIVGGKIVALPAAQDRMNEVASTMRTNPRIIAGREIPGEPNLRTIVFRIMSNDSSASAARKELEQSFSKAGLSAKITDELSGKILALLIAQPDNIDVNQLYEAVKLYNQIVKTADRSVLEKLKEDENFQELKDRLKQLVLSLKDR